MGILVETKHYKQRKEIITEIESSVEPMEETNVGEDHYFSAEAEVTYTLQIDGEHLGTVTAKEPDIYQAGILDSWSNLSLADDIDIRWPGLKKDLRNIVESRPPETFVRFVQHLVVRYFVRQADQLTVKEQIS